MRLRYFILIITLFSFYTNAQAQKKQVRQGNTLYQQKKYKEAAAAYQNALMKKPGYTPALFNLGNSLYQQKQFDATRKVLATAEKTVNEKQGKGAVDYNIGNTYMEEKKWQDAVDAYKQALRNNPQDADAKYNLSYALSMLKKQGGGGGRKNDKDKKDDKKNDKNNQGKNDQDKKDQQDKDNQNKDQDKKDQDKKDQQNKSDQDKEGDDKKPQPQPSKLSQQQAEQLLNALQQEEKKLQDKMQKAKGVPVKVEKDW
jgi:Ca-activated chloride channel family protein